MSVAKITEISAASASGFEEAIKHGISRAAKTVKNIESAWVKEQKVVVKNGKVVEYRVNLMITFILN